MTIIGVCMEKLVKKLGRVFDKERVNFLQNLLKQIPPTKYQRVERGILAILRKRSIDKYHMILNYLLVEDLETSTEKLLWVLTDIIRYSPRYILLLEICEFDKSEISRVLEIVETLPTDMGVCFNSTALSLDLVKELNLTIDLNIPDDIIVEVSWTDKECSVGYVRKMRDDVKNTDECCATCPYFLPRDIVADGCKFILEGSRRYALLRKISERRTFLYGGG